MAFQILPNTAYATAAIEQLVHDARKSITLVSPYFDLSDKHRIVAGLHTAIEQDVDVLILVREDAEKTVRHEVLRDLLQAGARIQTVPHLHAKLYWSDAGAVISSINLLKTSFEQSIEVGLIARDAQDREQVRQYIDSHVVPRTDLRSTARSAKKAPGSHRGVCIRCGDEIVLNPDRPLCAGCYEKWARFENPDYLEKHCHACGREWDSSMAKPLCRGCYAQAI